MSKRLEMLKALKALIAGALPFADVVGLDGEEAPPARVSPGGRVVVRTGDPGQPESDLSPRRYYYQHRIPIELTRYATDAATSEEAVDAMMVAIGSAVEADRYLGGLCEWLDTEAAQTEDLFVEGARPPRGADFAILAEYWTDNPLT